jgi:hypothetical protein
MQVKISPKDGKCVVGQCFKSGAEPGSCQSKICTLEKFARKRLALAATCRPFIEICIAAFSQWENRGRKSIALVVKCHLCNGIFIAAFSLCF